MKFSFLSVILLISCNAIAQQSAGWGVNIEDEQKKIKIGGRLQAIMESNSETESQDISLRRTRFNIVYKPKKGHKISYDVRNDKANTADKGEGKFVIGDAYWQVDQKHPWVKNIRFFRAKVDVSYSQTSSSRNLFNPNRAEVAENAASFVVHNRRAANIQANGNIGKLAYQVVISDGVHSDDLESLNGNSTISKINHQKLTYGGKVRYYFQGNAKKNKVQDTFYGTYDTFSIGLGYFQNDAINVTTDGPLNEFSILRKLTNLEISFAHKGLRILAEAFSFDGSIMNLDENKKEDVLGKSGGYYIQTEYLIGKWAPYIAYEVYDQNSDEDDSSQISQVLGLNYYENMEAQRYGLTYRKDTMQENIGDEEQEKLYAYIMLNF